MTHRAEASDYHRGDLLSMGKRVGKNTLWLLIGRIGTQGLMVVFTILLARRLGEVGLGQYAFIVSAIFFANVVSTFGTDMLLIREIASRRDLSLLPGALLLQLVIAIPIIVLVFLLAPALPNQTGEARFGLQLYSLALIPMAFYTAFSATLRGLERMNAFALLNLATAVVQVAALWVFIQPGASIVSLAELLLVVQVFSALVAGGLCLAQIRDFREAWTKSKPAIWRLLRASAPIAVLGLIKVLYQKLSVYMLATMEGSAATGWYAAALRAVEATQVGHIVLLGALFPLMSQANHGQGVEFDLPWRKTFRISWWLLHFMGAAGATFLFLLAPLLVDVLYGERFVPAIPVLKVLAWMLLPYSVNIYLSSQLISARREREVAITFGLSVLTLTVLNLRLIPFWSSMGASVAVLGAETVQAGLFLWFWRAYTQSR